MCSVPQVVTRYRSIFLQTVILIAVIQALVLVRILQSSQRATSELVPLKTVLTLLLYPNNLLIGASKVKFIQIFDAYMCKIDLGLIVVIQNTPRRMLLDQVHN